MRLALLGGRFWPSGTSAPAGANPPKRTRALTPLAGLTRTPEGEACEPHARSHPQVPGAPPPRMIVPRARRRQVAPPTHVCPQAACAHHGRVGCGHLRANGHPTGRRWRHLPGLSCRSYFSETLGPPFPAQQGDPDKPGWAIAAWAEGRGIRAVARVFAVNPDTALGWLVEAAEHREACSRSGLQEVSVEPGQRGALFAWLSAVTAGDVTEAEAIQGWSRSPDWGGVALDPVGPLILTVDVGERPLKRAQPLGPQVPPVLAPNGTPLFVTEGWRAYLTA